MADTSRRLVRTCWTTAVLLTLVLVFPAAANDVSHGAEMGIDAGVERSLPDEVAEPLSMLLIGAVLGLGASRLRRE